jgi:hypothetical protein
LSGITHYAFNIFTLALFFMLTGYALAAELPIPDDNADIQFMTRPGDVTFAHVKHTGLKLSQCSTCHVKLLPKDMAVKP